MKKSFLAFASIITTLLLFSCGPSQKDAIKFNDELIAIQKGLIPVHEAFLDQMNGDNPDSLKVTQEKFLAKTTSCLAECEKLKPISENHEYYEAAMDYFKTMNGLAMNEGKMMVDIVMKDSTRITEEDIAKYNQCGEKFESEYNRVYDKIEQAQNAFAREWKFELIEK